MNDILAKQTHVRSHFLNGLFFALFVWILFSAYPIGPYEPDGTTIANGAYLLDQTRNIDGVGLVDLQYNGLIYRYDVQAGSYDLIILFKNVFGTSYYSAFSILNTLAFVVFVVFTSLAFGRLTNCPFYLPGILILIFPEVAAAAGYPNSTMMALGFLALSFYCLSYKRYATVVISALFLGFAVWCRFDAVLLSPAIAALFLSINGKSHYIRKMFLFAITAFASTALLLYLSSSSLANVIRSVSEHGSKWVDKDLTVANYIAFYPLLVLFLFLVGLVYLVKEKRVILLIFVFFGTVVVYFTYGWTVTTGKYLLYSIFPFVLVMLFAFRGIRTANKLLKFPLLFVLALVFLYQYFPLSILPAYHKTVYSHDGERHVTSLLTIPFEMHKTKWRKREAVREIVDKSIELARNAEIQSIAVRDNHELTAMIFSEIISRDGFQPTFIANTTAGKVYRLQNPLPEFPVIAFYRGNEFPDILAEKFTQHETGLIYWTRWSPQITTQNSRRTALRTNLISLDVMEISMGKDN